MIQAFEKARAFIYRNARPLDLARFQYHLEDGDKAAVMRALSYYQNEDGGFGHGVEADCWNPHSITIHVGTACRIILDIDFDDADHPVIQGLLRWCESGALFNGHTWALDVPSNNDYPHAPWWHTDSKSACRTDYNETARIAGFIIRYAERDSGAFRLGLRIIQEAIAAIPPDGISDMHTCSCYVIMAEQLARDQAIDLFPYDALREKLHRSVDRLIEKDPAKWNAYVCRPSFFLSSRDSEFYPEHQAAAEAECDFILQNQQEDGSWPITWAWGAYPEEWAVSKNWWKSHLIIQNLLYLKGFGRL